MGSNSFNRVRADHAALLGSRDGDAEESGDLRIGAFRQGGAARRRIARPRASARPRPAPRPPRRRRARPPRVRQPGPPAHRARRVVGRRAARWRAAGGGSCGWSAVRTSRRSQAGNAAGSWRPSMWRKARTNASWAMSGASSRSPHSPTAEATAMSSNRSMSSGHALASPRWAAPTSAAQRSPILDQRHHRRGACQRRSGYRTASSGSGRPTGRGPGPRWQPASAGSCRRSAVRRRWGWRRVRRAFSWP